MNLQLRLVLLFPHFYTLEQSSSLRSWQIGRYLAAKGHDVTVVAPGVDLGSGELFPEMSGKLFAVEYVDGVRLIRVRSLTRFRRSALHRLAFEVIFAALTFFRVLPIPRVDIIVAAYPSAVMPIVGWALARLKRTFVVLEIRDLMADALEATGYVKSKWFVNTAKRVEVFVAKQADHVIAVSNGIKKAMVNKGVYASRIAVVTNGYEPEVFEGAQYDWDPRDDFGWGKDFVVVYAGALTQAYDIPTLLRSALRLKDKPGLRFAIIGEGERREEYQAYCRSHGLGSCQFLGQQARILMPVILGAADLGVHMFRNNPLWDYVLGNKTFDYLGSGLPMIYAGRGDTAELIEAAGAGFVVEPEDDAALATRILELSRNREGARMMGLRGQEYVKAHFNRGSLLAGFEAILIEVATRTGGRVEQGLGKGIGSR